jgi:hypothetical protein
MDADYYKIVIIPQAVIARSFSAYELAFPGKTRLTVVP